MKIIGVKMHDRTGDKSDFTEFDLCEVNYIERWRPTKHSAEVPAYHTSGGSYLALHTLKDIAAAYSVIGFESFDRSTVVNTEKVAELICWKNGTKVIFTDNSYVIVNKVL